MSGPAREPVIRWGILGAAQIASKFIVALLRPHAAGAPRSVLSGLASRNNTAKAQELLDSAVKEAGVTSSPSPPHQCRFVSSYEALLEDPAIDAVYIPVPNTEHYRWVMAALQHGKHVLVEKPAFLNAADAAAAASLAEGKGLLLLENYGFLHQQWTETAPTTQVTATAAVVSTNQTSKGRMGTIQEVLKSLCDEHGGVVKGTIRYDHPLIQRGEASCVTSVGLRGGAWTALGCYGVALACALTQSHDLLQRNMPAPVVNVHTFELDPQWNVDVVGDVTLSFRAPQQQQQNQPVPGKHHINWRIVTDIRSTATSRQCIDVECRDGTIVAVGSGLFHTGKHLVIERRMTGGASATIELAPTWASAFSAALAAAERIILAVEPHGHACSIDAARLEAHGSILDRIVHAHCVVPFPLCVAECDDPFRSVVVHTASSQLAVECTLPTDNITRVVSETGAGTPFDAASIAHVESTSHTMAYALPSYCIGKVPHMHIHAALQRDQRVCVWGLFDLYVIPYAMARGYKATPVSLPKKASKRQRIINAERPRLYLMEPLSGSQPSFFVLAVYPGSDYVYHYARMVRVVMEMFRRGSSDTLLEIRRFPRLEFSPQAPHIYRRWSGLRNTPIHDDDVLVLGHVNELFDTYTRRLDSLDVQSFAKLDQVTVELAEAAHQSNQPQKEHSPAPCAALRDGAFGFGIDTASIDDVLRIQRGWVEAAVAEGGDVQAVFDRLMSRGWASTWWSNWGWRRAPVNADVRGAVDAARRAKVAAAAAAAAGTKPFKPPLVSLPTAVFFLAARYSYWGDLVRPIANFAYSRTHSVIYAAKCGTLRSGDDIETIVVPSEYLLVAEPTDAASQRVSVVKNAFQMTFANHELAKRWNAMRGISVGGYHVSVPSIVGETYHMRRLITGLVEQDTRTRQTAREVLQRLQAKGLSTAVVNDIKKAAMAPATPQEQQTVLRVLAAQHGVLLPPEHATTATSPGAKHWRAFEMTYCESSMDNETAWFHVEGAAAKEESPMKPKFFQAIHRTTDFVRDALRAAEITTDDLDKQNLARRAELLETIGRMVFDLVHSRAVFAASLAESAA